MDVFVAEMIPLKKKKTTNKPGDNCHLSDQTIQCAQMDTSRQLARNGPPALSVQLFHQGNGQLKAEPKGAGPAPAAAELSSGSRPSRSDVPVSGDRMAPRGRSWVLLI